MTEQEEVEAILDVFTTEGWRLIVEDIKKHYDAINRIDCTADEDEFLKRRGELEKLGWFMNLPEWYKQVQDQDAAL